MLIFLLCNVIGKSLQFVAHPPLLSRYKFLLNIPDDLYEVVGIGFKLLDVCINSLAQQLLVVDRNLNVTVKIQFLGQSTKHGLEEGINGLYAEVPIIVQ